MRSKRIFHPETLAENSRITLDDTAGRHLIKALRLKAGDELVLFDGSGKDFSATLVQAGKRTCIAEVYQVMREEAEPGLRLVLAIGISRGERMDFSIQKAVELGINEIQPLFTERSMVQLKGDRLQNRLTHWRGVIRHACEQSGRSRVPGISEPLSLANWLDSFEGNGLMLDHRAEKPLVELSAPGTELTMLVGPEGGLSPTERQLAEEKGLAGVRLGPRVLRTETAPLAALAVIQATWGDFRS